MQTALMLVALAGLLGLYLWVAIALPTLLAVMFSPVCAECVSRFVILNVIP